MSTIKVYTPAGEAAREETVDDALLTLDRGEQAVHDTIVAILAGRRAGTACTLSKGEVAGSNKKPWKQKGTGNARAGFRQSPVWRGGGVAHGPRPRSFEKKVNRKVMALAFARAFAEKVQGGDVTVVSEFSFEAPKTKLMAAFLKKIGVERSALVLTGAPDENVFKMTRNLPRVAVMSAPEVDVYTLMRFKTVVVDKAAFDALMARAARKETK